ncbi:ABCB family ABC transporter ATP-binding protein/permease [Roseospirillum parvum]|uniref:ATP-binding cassette, subfamily B n=1 Tax=Roseospirillum parvum TaxID=83401 RepID=A0A1G7UFY4_9PROT|nr:ABC transporter ATP-binding protein/permease [Roseospirillum parvum]SDG45680.1 ATP-binding cassette, subfamily B [Roseospirillum parvum]
MRSRRPPPPPSDRPRNDLETLRRFLPHLWPGPEEAGWRDIRARVVISLILLLAAKAATITVPVLYKHAVDALSGASQAGVAISVPVGLLVGYGLVRVLQQAFAELQDAIFVKVTERAVRRMGLSTFRHLHALSLRFHLERRTGGLARIIERGTRGVEILLRLVMFRAGPSLVELLIVCAVMWGLYDWRFAAATLATIGGYVVFTMSVTEWRLKFRRSMNQSDAEANGKAIDSLLNYETVKYFGNEAFESDRYDRALTAYEQAAVTSKASLVVLNVGQGVIISLGLTGLMIMAGNGVAAGTMTVGDFVLVNSYLVQLALPLNFLGMVYREIKQALTDMEAMFALLDTPPEVIDRPQAKALPPGPGALAFKGVGFSYNPERRILSDVDFSVPAGHKVALVGPSGAGKSTIARLLFRFYDVTEGAITLDGHDLRQLSQDSLRAAIGVVPQDTVLFNDTIGYNIAYGRPSASRAEVEEAARLAAIHPFIESLPEGYETLVGERGLKLSGGEKQRVAIARTILKQPRILIFDEATSALDTHTEQEIQQALAGVARGRTTLVIAHRLSTVIDADQILVMERGRIVERGRHGELLDRGGAYAAMWQRQQEARRLADELAEVGGPVGGLVGGPAPRQA